MLTTNYTKLPGLTMTILSCFNYQSKRFLDKIID